MKNHKFWLENGKIKSRPATKKELEEAREKAKKLIKKDARNLAFRSCWQCNPAHYYFLEGEWGGWVLSCFHCGRFYYNKIDISEYPKKKRKEKG